MNITRGNDTGICKERKLFAALFQLHLLELIRLIAVPKLFSTLLNHLPIARSSGSDGFEMQVCIKDIKFKLLLSLSFIF